MTDEQARKALTGRVEEWRAQKLAWEEVERLAKVRVREMDEILKAFANG